jgi:SNF2 family DNA or RNA helicase
MHRSEVLCAVLSGLVPQTWRYLVLDEGHRVRNMDTLTAKALRSVQRGNVLLLTGAELV